MEQVATTLAEAHHRIANSLALLASLTRLQARAGLRAGQTMTAPELHHLLNGIAARLNAVAHLHRVLSQMPLEGRAPLRPYLREVCQDLIAAFSSPERPITAAHTGDDCELPVKHAHGLALMVCEIFINALKHAHPDGARLTVRVDCALAEDGRTILTIGDDGVGLPEGFNQAGGSGLGLRVIQALAGNMGATLDIVSGPGLSFRLAMPASVLPGVKLS
jgi:two-component sensor histidine kinase